MPADDLPFDLDAWLPDPAIRTRHRRATAAPADRLWDAAGALAVDATGPLGRLVRWRIPGLPPGETFRGLFAAPPFTVLDEGERWSVSGLVGRIWTLRRDYPRVEDASAFAAWAQPGTVRVLFAHWVVDGPDGGARCCRKPASRPSTAAPRCGCARSGPSSGPGSASSAARRWPARPARPSPARDQASRDD